MGQLWPFDGDSNSDARQALAFMAHLQFMDLITFDRVVAVLGFAITIGQLIRTHTAAEAARKSAVDAVVAIQRLTVVTNMYDIASRTRDLLRLLRASKALTPAATAAFELRDSVARYCHNAESKKLISDQEWHQALEDVRAVHERLESLSLISKASTQDRETLVHEVSRLHAMFAQLATKAAERVEV